MTGPAGHKPGAASVAVAMLAVLGPVAYLAATALRDSYYGAVSLDGEPLPSALVQFVPLTHGCGYTASAKTGRTGRYSLETLSEPPHGGALVGRHRVVITTAVGRAATGETIVPERVPPRYNHETTLTAEVRPGRNEFDFHLRTD